MLLLAVSLLLVAATPSGWDLVGSASHAYRFTTDRSIVHSGSQSARLESTESSDGFGAISQTIEADRYRGERVRLSAWLRAEGCTGWAGLWMRINDQHGRALGFDNMQNRPIRGDQEWQQAVVVLDVPPDAARMSFGAVLSGPGTLWIDGIELERVGPEVPVTHQIPRPQSGPQNLSFE